MVDYISGMDDNARTPALTADDLEALIEASLRELEAGEGRPMSAFVAELKADFRAAYPDIVEMLQPPQVDQYSPS
jgi:hypothetical protein